jgi:tmRNA-binding protein
LTKKELIKFKKGLTIIPLKLFLNEKGYCKVDIALAKGKKGIRQARRPQNKRFEARNGPCHEALTNP